MDSASDGALRMTRPNTCPDASEASFSLLESRLKHASSRKAAERFSTSHQAMSMNGRRERTRREPSPRA